MTPDELNAITVRVLAKLHARPANERWVDAVHRVCSLEVDAAYRHSVIIMLLARPGQVEQPTQMATPEDSPLRVLMASVKAEPAARFALVVAGAGAAGALVVGFSIGNARLAGWGTLVCFAVMILASIFAQLSRTKLRSAHALFTFLSWAISILFVVVLCSIASSIFLKQPLDLSSWIIGDVPAAPK